MRFQGHGLSLDVISFGAAVSACKQGDQWQHMAPLFDEMQSSGLIAGYDQLHRSHFRLRAGWAVAMCGAA
eukprot:5012285-Karenia_brevis.AAC.1